MTRTIVKVFRATGADCWLTVTTNSFAPDSSQRSQANVPPDCQVVTEYENKRSLIPRAHSAGAYHRMREHNAVPESEQSVSREGVRDLKM